MRATYDKLVRDRIPEIVRADGERPVTRRVSGAERGRYLDAKLREEFAEYRDTGTASELADLLAVVRARSAHHEADVAGTAARKRAERGGFEEGIVLEAIDRDDGEEPDHDAELVSRAQAVTERAGEAADSDATARVGGAVRTPDGTVYDATGRPPLDAGRAAVATAVGDGHEVERLALHATAGTPLVDPRCRRWLDEFGTDPDVHLSGPDGVTVR